MLAIYNRLEPHAHWDEELHLNFDARSKSRLRCFSATGEEVSLFLERDHRPGLPELASPRSYAAGFAVATVALHASGYALVRTTPGARGQTPRQWREQFHQSPRNSLQPYAVRKMMIGPHMANNTLDTA